MSHCPDVGPDLDRSNHHHHGRRRPAGAGGRGLRATRSWPSAASTSAARHCPTPRSSTPGSAALLPGFVEPHSHPVMSGVATQPPARSIAPWDAPTWADVEKIFADAIADTDPSTPLLFAGFDALLHGRPSPKADELDRDLRRPGRGDHRQLRPRRVLQHRADEAQRLGRQPARRPGRRALRPQRRRQPERPGFRDCRWSSRSPTPLLAQMGNPLVARRAVLRAGWRAAATPRPRT